MTDATRRPSSSSRKSLVDAGLEDLPAVDVAEEALEINGGARLLARLQAGDCREHAEELGAPRRKLRRKASSLGQMRAIAAIEALADTVHGNCLGWVRVRRIDQPREIEIVRDDG